VIVAGALFPLAIIDYLYVRSGQNNNSIWWSPWVNWPAILLVPIGFFWANWPAISKAPLPLSGRIALNVVFAVVIAVVWFFVMVPTILLPFHIGFGGWL